MKRAASKNFKGHSTCEYKRLELLRAPEYATLRHRLEAAHAAVEAALVEARRRVRLNERQGE